MEWAGRDALRLPDAATAPTWLCALAAAEPGAEAAAARHGVTVVERPPGVLHVSCDACGAAPLSGGLFVTVAEIAACGEREGGTIWHVSHLPPGTLAAVAACPALQAAWRETEGCYRVLYHGTDGAAASALREDGLRPSEGGMMGPGVYLGSFFKAARYAMYNSARLNAGAALGRAPPTGSLPDSWYRASGAVARVLVDMRGARLAVATCRAAECACATCAAEAAEAV